MTLLACLTEAYDPAKDVRKTDNTGSLDARRRAIVVHLKKASKWIEHKYAKSIRVYRKGADPSISLSLIYVDVAT